MRTPAKPSSAQYGKVYLIGAGPGAADLITVRGARILAQANVVLHDALVTEDMLALCPQARQIAVGKRCGRLSTAQTFINKQLIDNAAKYAIVVRLKGFFVRDNSAGFDMAYAKKMFAAFQRMHQGQRIPGYGRRAHRPANYSPAWRAHMGEVRRKPGRHVFFLSLY